MAAEADQRYARERQEFQRDVQREEIPAHEHQVQRAPHGEQQQPEHQRRTALRTPGGVPKSARAYTPMPPITTAMASSMITAAVGAQRNAPAAAPSRPGCRPRYRRLHQCVGDGDGDNETGREDHERHLLGPAAAEDHAGQHPINGTSTANTSSNPPGTSRPWVERNAASMHPGIGLRLGWRIRGKRDRTGFVEQSQHQRDGERGGREGDDDAGDQQRLRHRVATHPDCRASACDGAEEQEHPQPIRLNARILRSGCGLTIRPYRPTPTSAAAHSPNSVDAFTGRHPLRRAGHQQGERQHERGHQRDFDGDDQRFRIASG